MYNKGEGEEANAQGLEGGLQTEGLRQRRPIFPAGPTASPASVETPEMASPRLCITVAPFTGGPFEVRVAKSDTIEDLKKVIARRLKVAKERIYLLYRESELVEGSIGTNLLVDGSTVTLLPRAETGLISPKPEQSVMQALESLNETQVNDFLSGAAPLNLTMRLGDHMMLIQLQLSTNHAANMNTITARRKSTIQISSSSPTYPTPPPSAPASPSPTLYSTSWPSSSSSTSPSSTSSSASPPSSSASPPPAPPRKVRVPLLSPGGLYSSSSPLLTPPPPAPHHPEEPAAKRTKLDPKALAEASKNLTQTLKQLSSEVLTTKPEASSQKPKKEERRKRRATDSKGAIIESMHHHGKGVYSGTFSGTLNPALQDANGQPKRDITTIVHILNDLLCAQFKSFARESRSSRHREARGSQGAEKQGSNFESQDASARKVAESQLELTRSKVEELRKLIAERKARRVLRREAAARAASYSTAWSLTKECDKHEGEGEGERRGGVQEQCQPPDFLLPSEPEPCTA